MTRDEALKIIENDRYDGTYGEGDYYADYAEYLIDEIYDDFENKVCKNCKYFNKVGLAGYSCSNKKNKNMHSGESIIWVDKEFGCNRFERIENEGD